MNRLKINLPFIIAFFIMLLPACKDKPDLYGYISGTLYDSCNGQPSKNKKLRLVQRNTYNNSPNDNIGEGVTDNAGYFKISYAAQKFGDEIAFLSEEGTFLLSLRSDSALNIDGVKVYNKYPTCDIIVRLNAINPYTANDTLRVSNLTTNPGYISIPGPFTNGILFTVQQHKMYPTLLANGATGTTEQLVYYMNNNNTQYNRIYFAETACETAEVTIDLQ